MFCEFIASHPSTFFDIAVVCMHINTRGLETRHLPCVSLIIKDIRLKCYVLEQNDPFFFFLWFYVKCCWTTHWLIPTSQRNDLKYRYKNFFFFFFLYSKGWKVFKIFVAFDLNSLEEIAPIHFARPRATLLFSLFEYVLSS